LTDQKFRKKVADKLNTIKPGAIIDTDPKPIDYKIIFGIISESKKDLNIPFFSKVNFKTEKSFLNAFGYKNISLVKIQRKSQ